ncbi:hypothetical protein D3C77_602930 [compost metagenome]
MGNAGNRQLLHVVGGQPVVVGADVLLEKRPGLARKVAQKAQVFGSGVEVRARGGAADPPGQCRAGQPRQQQGRSQGQGHGAWQQAQAHDQGQYRGAAHAAVQSPQAIDTGAFDFP